MTYYEILGISITATQQEIKEAYRRESKKWHPDFNHSKDATSRMQSINEAYQTLSDLEKRKDYDDKISRQKTSYYSSYSQRTGSQGSYSQRTYSQSTYSQSTYSQGANRRKNAYNNASSSRSQSRNNRNKTTDEWISDYNKKRRIMDDIYDEYVDTLIRSEWLANHFSYVPNPELFRKRKLEQYISNWYYNNCGIDKIHFGVLPILFNRVEIFGKDAFPSVINGYYYSAEEKEGRLYDLYKQEFSTVCNRLAGKKGTISFLAKMKNKYSRLYGINELDPDNHTYFINDISSYLSEKLDTNIALAECSKMEVFEILFREFESCFKDPVYTSEDVIGRNHAVHELSDIIEIYLSKIQTREEKEEIYTYLNCKRVKSLLWSSLSLYGEELNEIFNIYINSFMDILNPYRRGY